MADQYLKWVAGKTLYAKPFPNVLPWPDDAIALTEPYAGYYLLSGASNNQQYDIFQQQGASPVQNDDDNVSTYYNFAPPANLYANNTAARDQFFSGGVLYGQTVITEGLGTYVLLKDYSGPFGSAVLGDDFQYIPQLINATASASSTNDLGTGPYLKWETGKTLYGKPFPITLPWDGDTMSLSEFSTGYYEFPNALNNQQYEIYQQEGGSELQTDPDVTSYYRFAPPGNLYAADNSARDNLFIGGLLHGQSVLMPDREYVLLVDYTGPFGSAQAGVVYQEITYSSGGGGEADGANLYAATTTDRDNLFFAGRIAGDEIIQKDYGSYIFIDAYQGTFENAVEGLHYEIELKTQNDGRTYYAADSAAVDTITQAGVIAGDAIVEKDVAVYIWNAPYTGPFASATTEYDSQKLLDGGSHYAADNAARDQFFTDGLLAGDLVYLATSGSEGSYIMLLDYQGPYSGATPGSEYIFIASQSVPPTGDIQQAQNPVAY